DDRRDVCKAHDPAAQSLRLPLCLAEPLYALGSRHTAIRVHDEDYVLARVREWHDIRLDMRRVVIHGRQRAGVGALDDAGEMEGLDLVPAVADGVDCGRVELRDGGGAGDEDECRSGHGRLCVIRFEYSLFFFPFFFLLRYILLRAYCY